MDIRDSIQESHVFSHCVRLIFNNFEVISIKLFLVLIQMLNRREKQYFRKTFPSCKWNTKWYSEHLGTYHLDQLACRNFF